MRDLFAANEGSYANLVVWSLYVPDMFGESDQQVRHNSNSNNMSAVPASVPYQSTSRIFSTFYVQPSHRWFIPGCMFYRVATDLENLEKSGNLKETSDCQGICLILVREFVTEFQKSGNFVV